MDESFDLTRILVGVINDKNREIERLRNALDAPTQELHTMYHVAGELEEEVVAVNPHASDRKNPDRCSDYTASCETEPCPDCELADV